MSDERQGTPVEGTTAEGTTAAVYLALTPAHRALLETDPGVARRAVTWVFHTYGPILPDIEAFRVAELATARAAQTCDSAKGSFSNWAFWRACHAILDAASAEHGHLELLRHLRAAWFERCARDRRDGADPSAPAAASLEAFEAHARDLPEKLAKLACTWADEAVEDLWAHGEDRSIARLDAKRDARALRQVLRGLSPWQRRVLALEFKDEKTLKEIAPLVGVHYRVLLERHTQLVALVRARLQALGVRTVPPWFGEAAKGILEELEAELADEPPAAVRKTKRKKEEAG